MKPASLALDPGLPSLCASQVAQIGKNLPANAEMQGIQETQVRSLGQEDPLK